MSEGQAIALFVMFMLGVIAAVCMVAWVNASAPAKWEKPLYVLIGAYALLMCGPGLFHLIVKGLLG